MSSTGKANAALASAIVFLLMSTCAAYFAFARLRTSQEWVQHTKNVQLALHQFSTMATRAGRLRAQYVDSGGSSFLQRQQAAVADLRNALAGLQRLVSDNVSQVD